MTTVEDLPIGVFHLAVIVVGETGIPILDGEIIKEDKNKELCDLVNGAYYDGRTKVALFQQTEVSEIIIK